MRTIEKTVYKFEELPENVQSVVLERERGINVSHYWYDSVYEDAETIGRILGLSDMKIQFSGFCSQGDGASFSASFQHNKGMKKALKAYAPKDKDLQEIASLINKAQAKAFYRLSGDIKTRGFYNHSGTMYISDYYINGDYYYGSVDYETDILDAYRLFADWIYKQLETEYDYLTSKEAIIEAIKANDYEFDIDGRIV